MDTTESPQVEEVSTPTLEGSTNEPTTKPPKAPKKVKGASKPTMTKTTKMATKLPSKPPKAVKAKVAKVVKPTKVAKIKAPKSNKPRKARIADDARLVGKSSGGKLNAAQVRILRALRDSKQPKGEMTRDDIKEAVGIGRDGKYSKDWLDGLWALYNDSKHRYILVLEPEPGERKMYHSITKEGKEILKASEAAAKKEAKEAA